jgi:hypothetical protein
MRRYAAMLAILLAAGCASDPLSLPEGLCPQRRCSETPEEVVAQMRTLGLNQSWEIYPGCLDYDVRMIAGLVRISERTSVRMAVWGLDSALSRDAILRALGQPQVHANRLQLAFFGNAADAEKVKAAVAARGGIYVDVPPFAVKPAERVAGGASCASPRSGG